MPRDGFWPVALGCAIGIAFAVAIAWLIIADGDILTR